VDSVTGKRARSRRIQAPTVDSERRVVAGSQGRHFRHERAAARNTGKRASRRAEHHELDELAKRPRIRDCALFWEIPWCAGHGNGAPLAGATMAAFWAGGSETEGAHCGGEMNGGLASNSKRTLETTG
jgi:hypothetical protein